MPVDFIQWQMISWSTIIFKVKEQDMFFWFSCLTNNSTTKVCVCVCVYLHLLQTLLIRSSGHHSRWLIIGGSLFFPPSKECFAISFIHVLFFPLRASLVKKLFVTHNTWPILPCALTSTRQEGWSRRARVISAHVCCPSSFTCILSTLLPSVFFSLFLIT